jgi:aminopeptidase YwaD
MKNISVILCILISNLIFKQAKAQNSTYRSLLPERVMDEIIGEASGETAMSHIIELGAYNHNRPASEYSGNFLETDYVISRLEEYGLEDIVVNRYPGGSYWDGISGELWEVSPGLSKLADYRDLTAMLASGSTNTDVEAELVWVGSGSEEEIVKTGVEGKIVLSSGSPRSVHTNAVKHGALGVVSFNSPRPLEVSLAIPITGISGRGSSDENLTFGFFLPPREGHILRDRLLAGEKIKVHATVESQTLEYQQQVPECAIKGTNPDAGEIILTAHLFEGYVKQGANDNLSGSAAILEVARMLKSMIDDGIIERPERTIRFLWIPEFSGTIPWVAEHMSLMDNTLCNLNLDMVGIKLADSKSFLCLQRTTYGNAHYLNDVMENYYEYVGITNREGLAISGRGGYLKRIVAPSGSDDPFYFKIDDHYGSSDHEVFNDPAVKVPGIMMITWPDLYYHTSQDRADKCDATQMKRVCVITAAAAYTIADAGEAMALKIGNEVAGNSSERIGAQLRRATDLIDNADKDTFNELWLRGYRYIEAAILNEKATIRSIEELGLKDAEGFLSTHTDNIEAVGRSNLDAYVYYVNRKAELMGLKPVKYSLSKEENDASRMIPVITGKMDEAGYGVGRGIMREASELTDKYPVEGRLDINEILRLCDGSYNVFEIKMLLDGQMKNGETRLSDVVNTFKILDEMEYVIY